MLLTVATPWVNTCTRNYKYAWASSRVWTCHCIHIVICDIWLHTQSEGSIKLHVPFAKEPYKRDYIRALEILNMHEFRHAYECVISYICINHVSHINESYHTYEYLWFQLHVYSLFYRALLQMKVSFHTYASIMSHISMNNITRTNESYRTHDTYEYLWFQVRVYSLFYRALLQKRPIILSILPTDTWHVWINFIPLVFEKCQTYGWVMLLIGMNHGTHMNDSCHTYEWIMPHIWMRHVTHMNESCHTYDWVMSHIWMNHVTHMNDSCHTYERIMSHIWLRHVTHINESCHTYEWIMSHIWMNHVTHMTESCHACARVTSNL